MNKQTSLLLKFEAIFIFVDLKVILLIVMLFNFYKETVLLADIVKPNERMKIVDLLLGTWERAGAGYWKWIMIAMLADVILKRMLQKLNE